MSIKMLRNPWIQDISSLAGFKSKISLKFSMKLNFGKTLKIEAAITEPRVAVNAVT